MVMRGEHVSLVGQVSSSRVDQVQTRKFVLHGDLLGSQVLSHGDGEVGSSLDGGVVSDNHACDSIDLAQTGDNATGRDLVLSVHLMTSQQRQLHKGGAWVNEGSDSVSGENLVLGQMLGLDLLRNEGGISHLLMDTGQLVGKHLETLLFLGKVCTQRINLRLDHVEVRLFGRDMLVQRPGETQGPG